MLMHESLLLFKNDDERALDKVAWAVLTDSREVGT